MQTDQQQIELIEMLKQAHEEEMKNKLNNVAFKVQKNFKFSKKIMEMRKMEKIFSKVKNY